MTEFKQSQVSRAVWHWTREKQPVAPPESCRKRAVIQFGVMLVIAGLLSLKSKHAAVSVCGIAIFVIVSGLFIPRLFRAVERGFKTFGRWVGVTLTWLLLVPFFFIVFAPARLVLLLARKDPMRRKFPTDAASCWQPHVVRGNKDHYTKQYK